MDVREKLVGLVHNARMNALWHNAQKPDEYITDMLIEDGVTVQEEAKLYWKPIKKGEWNLTCSACDSHLGCREDANFCPECGAKFVRPKALTLQPPKGE